MKQFAVFFAAFCTGMFTYWLSGADFQRSPMLAGWFIGSVIFAAWVAVCQGIKD